MASEGQSPFGDQQSESAQPRSQNRVFAALRLIFGVSDPVGRKAYAATGFGLMTLKYLIEALVIWLFTSSIYQPWHFLNPIFSMRNEMLQPAPTWVGWALFIWTLPFLWIAISMSVRRAADAGASPWTGLLVLIPLVNLVFMVVMCFVSSAPGQHWSPPQKCVEAHGAAMRAVMSLAVSLMIGGAMLAISIYWLSSYGASLFVGTPLVMGASVGYLYNRPEPRGYGASIGLGLAVIVFAGAGLLLFALEGMICVAMALPLLLPLGALGGLMGKAIADATRRTNGGLIAAIACLPLLAGVESLLIRKTEYEVMTAVEIDAPPEVVWQNVVDFPDLDEPTEWYFRLGIACPERARIAGSGVGATRYCEFTTGTFVEPITVWDEPRRLAFDVTDQPAPMFELSPYRHVHPPHLDGYLRSNRGEFRLITLPGHRTRLEGRTWYEFDMFPQRYWTLWSDLLIHRIHQRVLRHIKQLSESPIAKAANQKRTLNATRK